MPETQTTRRALALAALSAVAFGLMAFLAKLATARLPGAEVASVRFLLMLAPLLWPPVLRRVLVVQRLDLLLYRGVFGGTAVLCYFLAIAHVPVGLATLINYSAPIFSVPIAAVFLNERIDRRFLLPLGAALIGVALVVRSQQGPGEPFRFSRWEAIGLLSAALSGAAVASLRAARRTESSWSIYASFSFFGLLVALPFAVASWRRPTSQEGLLLAGVGLASIAAQLLMTHAYRWVTNLQMGVCSQLAVIVAMALGIAFLGEPRTPLGLSGSALTIASVLATVALQATPRAIE